MSDRLIVSMVSICMLIWTCNVKGSLHLYITALLTFSIYITWFEIPAIKTFSMITYVIAVITALVYAFIQSQLKPFEKYTILIVSIFVLINMLFGVMHWPYATGINLLMIFPTVSYFYYLKRTRVKRNSEIGFITILFFFCLLRFLRTVMPLLYAL